MFNLLKFELYTNIFQGKSLFHIISFFIISLFLFGFFNVNFDNNQSIIIIFILAILSSIIGITNFWTDDIKNGWIIQNYLAGLSFTKIIIVRLITFWIMVWIPILFILPLASLILDLDNVFYKLLLGLFLSSFIFTLIEVVLSLLNIYKNNVFLNIIIILPFKLPIMILTIYICINNNINYISCLLVEFGILLVLMPLFIFLGQFLLKNS